MLHGHVTIKLDMAALENLKRGPDGLVGRYMQERATIVQLAAIRDCPKRTLKLSESIVKRPFPTLYGFMVSIIAIQPYAYWVHEGTGIYGPHASRIYPKTKYAMRWLDADGDPVFARSTKGMKGTRFLADNLPLFFE